MDNVTRRFMDALNHRRESDALVLLERVDIRGALTGDGQTALHVAARFGCASVVEALLARQAPIEAQTAGGSTPLMMAAGGGHVAALRLLLDAGADAGAENAGGYTALQVAETNGRVDALKLLEQRTTC